jgi:tryptophan halogenase
LYIDCSGYSSTLIDEVEPNGRIPLAPYLTHDKAIVVEVAYQDTIEEMRPRTGAKALSSGWMWDIPLYDRIFNGYVYTSDFITPEDA